MSTLSLCSYSSGKTLLQRAGHPCTIEYDRNGASECEEGLVCRDSTGSGYTTGAGVCTLLAPYAGPGQACDADFGPDACRDSGYACGVPPLLFDGPAGAGAVRTGVCQRVGRRAGPGGVCDASYGSAACASDHVCLGSNGSELGEEGLGVCTRLARRQRPGGSCDLSHGNKACETGYYCQDDTRRAGLNAPMRAGSVGTGACVRATSVGEVCSSHEECGPDFSCLGLGDDSRVSSLGTTADTTGYCG